MSTSPVASIYIPSFIIDSATEVKRKTKVMPFLPPEIRLEIWKMSSQETRIVSVEYAKQDSINMTSRVVMLRRSTLLKVSREARHYALHQSYPINLNYVDDLFHWNRNPQSQDIWINPSHDIVYFNIHPPRLERRFTEAMATLISFGSGFGPAASEIQHIMLPIFLIRDFVPRYGADIEEKDKYACILRSWFGGLKTLAFSSKDWGENDDQWDVELGESRPCLETKYKNELSHIRRFFSRRQKELAQMDQSWNPPEINVV